MACRGESENYILGTLDALRKICFTCHFDVSIFVYIPVYLAKGHARDPYFQSFSKESLTNLRNVNELWRLSVSLDGSDDIDLIMKSKTF